MKVLILYPNYYGMNLLPISVGLLTAILKAEGHELRLFDTTVYPSLKEEGGLDFDKAKSENLNARPFDDPKLKALARRTDVREDFKKLVGEFGPDLIAMSATEDTYSLGIDMLSVLGEERPPVVAGGIFPTSAPEITLRLSRGTIDYLLAGEGEHTLPEFCRKLEEGGNLLAIKGLHYIEQGDVKGNLLPAVVDINTNPIPDFSLFDESRFYRPMQGMLRRMLPVETHRGCPYGCTFCSMPWVNKMYKGCGMNFFRKKKMVNVYRDLINHRDKYHADSFFFTADTFLTLNNKEFDQFCELYQEIRLPFWMQTRAETVDELKIKRLQEIGLLRMAFGIEHGDEDFRARILARKIKNQLLVQRLNLAVDIGIPISVNNIIGFPTETRELAFKTIEINRLIRSDGTNAYTFAPFHGTPLRQMCEDLKLITPGLLAKSVTSLSLLNMPYFPKEEIEGIRRCFVLYVKMPKSYWPKIKEAEALTPRGDKIFEELKEECRAKYITY